MKLNKKLFLTLFFAASAKHISAQVVPAVFSNIYFDNTAKNYYFKNPVDNKIYYADTTKTTTIIQNFSQLPLAYDSGFILNFGTQQNGSVLYGLKDINNKMQQVVYYRYLYALAKGKVKVDILSKLIGNYDFINWQKNGRGKIGYRFFSTTNQILFDGSFVFTYKNKKFALDTCMSEGPFVANMESKETTIWFETNLPIVASIVISNAGNKKSYIGQLGTHHEIRIKDLQANTNYKYTIVMGDYSESFSFTTFPEKGTQNAFAFAYASDCRMGQGGNERNVMGVNSYVMSRIASYAVYENARFMQVTGDLINGYDIDENKINLEYRSYRNVISPYAAQVPFYMGMGNHEVVAYEFGGYDYAVDKFPFEKCSQEKVFADNFVNPLNGPMSEDHSKLDPNLTLVDFPSYAENVYYYTCGNVAMIVLNSEYLYTQNENNVDKVGGNIHAYIMDNQLQWLTETLAKMELDKTIDHVFVTFHSPMLPNGGHVADDMWYNGNNNIRPVIAGKPAEKGIIERRDQLLDLLVNKSTKVVGVLTGDEHNYSRTLISPETKMYTDGYQGARIQLKRSIWQITNGAAGAPYYGKEETPWVVSVQKFAVQYALCMFYISGKQVNMKVINPETLEMLEDVSLK
ncbi:MAG: metallophosphoesterase family protein [Bacteroidota bacterium]